MMTVEVKTSENHISTSSFFSSYSSSSFLSSFCPSFPLCCTITLDLILWLFYLFLISLLVAVTFSSTIFSQIATRVGHFPTLKMPNTLHVTTLHTLYTKWLHYEDRTHEVVFLHSFKRNVFSFVFCVNKFSIFAMCIFIITFFELHKSTWNDRRFD